MKQFKQFEITTIKRTAQNVAPLVAKRDKLFKKRDEIQAELDVTIKSIAAFEEPIKVMTGGFSSEELTKRVVNDKGQAKYVLRYPDTVIPPQGNLELDTNPKEGTIDDEALKDIPQGTYTAQRIGKESDLEEEPVKDNIKYDFD